MSTTNNNESTSERSRPPFGGDQNPPVVGAASRGSMEEAVVEAARGWRKAREAAVGANGDAVNPAMAVVLAAERALYAALDAHSTGGGA